MIVTKAGRRMFPVIKLSVSGLCPDSLYVVLLDIVPADTKRYRYIYHSSQWLPAGEGNPSPSPNLYLHPDSPSPGSLLMSRSVTFDKIKLTNNGSAKVRGQVSLHSMQKYIPQIHIIPTSECNLAVFSRNAIKDAFTFTFNETEFVTVTAYQNQKITKLKIASNPFARGFRESLKIENMLHCEKHLPFEITSDGIETSAFQRYNPAEDTKPSKDEKKESKIVLV
uniref:T-box domain-containing protein n=1 Tax=Clastoptera arizonana TaxID=38151 RepID=A0A1B6CEG8_9HEMI